MRRAYWLCLLCSACGAHAPAHPAAPENPDPLTQVSGEELYQRGVALGQAGDYIRAEQYLTAAIDRGYDEDQAMPALLGVCVQSSRLSAALGYAEPYLTRHPTNWSLRLLVATIRMGMGQPQRAREELTRVLTDAPSEPAQAHYFLGVLYRDRLEDPAASLEHFRRYLALDPQGAHVEEARAALPAQERGLPVRVDRAALEQEGTP